MNQAILLLGSNIEPEKNIPAGLAHLASHAPILATSTFYESVPIGLKEQPNFYNVAVLIETGFDPAGIKQHLITPIEQQLGRQRTANKNAPRTLDIDLILFNQQLPPHQPNPELFRFAHVAVPVAELAPHFSHPTTNQPLTQIANQLNQEAMLANGGRPVLWPISPR